MVAKVLLSYTDVISGNMYPAIRCRKIGNKHEKFVVKSVEPEKNSFISLVRGWRSLKISFRNGSCRKAEHTKLWPKWNERRHLKLYAIALENRKHWFVKLVRETFKEMKWVKDVEGIEMFNRKTVTKPINGNSRLYLIVNFFWGASADE